MRDRRIFLSTDPDQMREQVQDRLNRLQLEASDHRLCSWFFPEVAPGTAAAPSYILSNNLLKPTRNHRYLQLAFSGFATNAACTMDITTYAATAAHPPAAANQILRVTLGAGAGWRTGTSITPVTPGREYVDSSTGWGLDIVGAGGFNWTQCLIELTYEDFVPFLR